MYGRDTGDCIEIRAASTRVMRAIDNTYELFGVLQIQASVTPTLDYRFYLSSTWNLDKLRGNASVVITNKFDGELLEWWDHIL